MPIDSFVTCSTLTTVDYNKRNAIRVVKTFT